MRSDESLQALAGELEACHAKIEEADLGLEERVRHAVSALTTYRRFRKRIAESSFDVRVLARRPDKGVAEGPFDWQSFTGSE